MSTIAILIGTVVGLGGLVLFLFSRNQQLGKSNKIATDQIIRTIALQTRNQKIEEVAHEQKTALANTLDINLFDRANSLFP